MCSERSTRAALLMLCFALVVASGGCGKKGDPQPAPRTIPQAVSDLTVRQRGLEVVLEMSHPKTTVAGLPYDGLDEVVLYLLERTAATVAVSPVLPPPDRREFEAAAQPLLRVGGAELASAISGDRLTLRYRLAEPIPAGAPLRHFAVRTHAAGGEASDLSNIVSLLARPPLAAPANLVLAPRKDGIELRWSALPDAVAGYHVYRRTADRTAYGAPLAAIAPATAPASPEPASSSALDSSAAFGQRYVYAVVAVAAREPLVEGALSTEREILYEDRFGPAPPRGLMSLPGEGFVRLVWEGVAEPDVAGYLVERADPGSDFHRVTTAPIAELELTDRGLASGFLFRYRVAAIDRSGNLGNFSSAIEARVP